MKKILLALICLLFIHSFKAQGWCKPGATWHCDIYHLGGWLGGPINSTILYGVAKYQYTGDTVLNGIGCNIINGTFTGITNGSTMTNSTLANFSRFYTYQNNKVIYARSSLNNNLDTIVNFNAAIGDKWKSNRQWGTCDGRTTITVIDTGRVQINSLSLKKIVTTYTATTNNPTVTITVSDTIIERIISRISLMFPGYCVVANPVLDMPSPYYGTFRCYEDNNFPPYKRAGVTTCGFVGFKELSGNRFRFKIYPNPCLDHLVIEAEGLNQGDFYTINLFNVLGQCVNKEEIKSVNNQLKINLADLNSGIYYVQLRDKIGLLASEKIIKE